MKKLSLIKILKEEESANLNQQKPSPLQMLLQQYGISLHEWHAISNIEAKLLAKGSTLLNFIQQVMNVSGQPESASEQWPTEQSQTDPFSQFEGQEEDPEDRQEAEAWQNTLKRRNELQTRFARQGLGTGSQVDQQSDPHGTAARSPNARNRRK